MDFIVKLKSAHSEQELISTVSTKNNITNWIFSSQTFHLCSNAHHWTNGLIS